MCRRWVAAGVLRILRANGAHARAMKRPLTAQELQFKGTAVRIEPAMAEQRAWVVPTAAPSPPGSPRKWSRRFRLHVDGPLKLIEA